MSNIRSDYLTEVAVGSVGLLWFVGGAASPLPVIPFKFVSQIGWFAACILAIVLAVIWLIGPFFALKFIEIRLDMRAYLDGGGAAVPSVFGWWEFFILVLAALAFSVTQLPDMPLIQFQFLAKARVEINWTAVGIEVFLLIIIVWRLLRRKRP